MTPEHIALVTASAARLRDRLPEIADAFYHRLFEAHPHLRSLFPEDRTALRVKFADELHAIVQAIPDFPAFIDRTHALGARHVDYHVRAEHYTHARDALLATLADRTPPADWSDETATAWRLAYDLTTEAMLLGATGAVPVRRAE